MMLYSGISSLHRIRLKKLVKVNTLNPSTTTTELFDLSKDPFERNDLAGKYSELVAEMEIIMQNARRPSPQFPYIERLN